MMIGMIGIGIYPNYQYWSILKGLQFDTDVEN